MKTPAFTILTSAVFIVPFSISSPVIAQEGGTFTYPKGDPGLYRSVETEIKIQPNFRKEADDKSSAYPPQPKGPLIPPPPIPPVEEVKIPAEEKPAPIIPQANPLPKTYRSQVPRLESVPQNSEPERRFELQDNPRIDIPTPPPSATVPRHTYPPQNPYRSENTFPSPVFPPKPPPAPAFPIRPRALPTPSQSFPSLPNTFPGAAGKTFPHDPHHDTGGPTVVELRQAAHDLSRQGLAYKYGHFTPRFGGLDSSGSVQYLLTELGIRAVPRTIGGQFAWLKDHNMAVRFENRPAVPDLVRTIVPGNLVFWGEFETGRLTHVMVYLGYDAQLGQHFAFGTRGGSEVGLHNNEVDVFDLKLDRERIVATGKIPGLNCH